MKPDTRRGFLLQCLQAMGALATPLLPLPAPAGSRTALVTGVRVAASQGTTRVVFDLTAPVSHHVFALHDPERIVVDLERSSLFAIPEALRLTGTALRSVRYGKQGQALRIVFDVTGKLVSKSFVLPPSESLGHRLVVDLRPPATAHRRPRSVRSTKQAAAPVPVEPAPRVSRDLVIAIDPGHGGKDPGATGRRGTREKNVVLSIARRLKALVGREPGMRAVMTRERDVFIPLRGRISKARRYRADIFVSIHADAARNRSARGASVYVLSPRGATSEHARWLAQNENKVDLVSGVSLGDKDDVLKSVLLDLSQTATLEDSFELAESILKELKRVGRVRSKRVEQAGFVVLKSPDIPSVLVETAFISNPSEERRLNKGSHQEALAKAILRVVKDYLRANAPLDTRFASLRGSRHVIRKGETLSTIASRYRVKLGHLRRANALRGDRIRVGQVLTIPAQDS